MTDEEIIKEQKLEIQELHKQIEHLLKVIQVLKEKINYDRR